jgi:hypothetical protein
LTSSNIPLILRKRLEIELETRPSACNPE